MSFFPKVFSKFIKPKQEKHPSRLIESAISSSPLKEKETAISSNLNQRTGKFSQSVDLEKEGWIPPKLKI
jgi:hypothetical protein